MDEKLSSIKEHADAAVDMLVRGEETGRDYQQPLMTLLSKISTLAGSEESQ